MLLIDGVKYDEWIPPDEDGFELVVVEHAKDIFGENAQYFNIKRRLESFFGKTRIPDGYVIEFTNPPKWHVVEIELSNHPLDSHIREQVSDFITATQKIISQNRQKITDEIFHAIDNNKDLRKKIEYTYGTNEIYWFLKNLILDHDPNLTIIIEKKKDTVEEHLKAALRYEPLNIIEFRTFIQDDVDLPHAHLFKSLFTPNLQPATPISGDIWVYVTGQKEHNFTIPKEFRELFPGFHVHFTLIADTEEIETCVAGAKKDIPHGDLKAGIYFSLNLKNWFKKHQSIKEGDKIKVSVIEPMKKYRLEIL
jgi:hypothetical protein